MFQERSWSTGDIAEETTTAFGRIQFYPADTVFRRRSRVILFIIILHTVVYKRLYNLLVLYVLVSI